MENSANSLVNSAEDSFLQVKPWGTTNVLLHREPPAGYIARSFVRVVALYFRVN